ncbi:MAG: hypothetical protein QME40_04060 [bacterium]|nr:hypothetical protein [bacterium]
MDLRSLIISISLFVIGCSHVTTITIKREILPEIDVDEINRVGIICLGEDEDLTNLIVEEWKAGLFNSPFYILSSFEVEELTEGIEKIGADIIDDKERRIELSKKLEADALLIFDIKELKEDIIRNYEVKSYYDKDVQRYSFYKVFYIQRYMDLDMDVKFFTVKKDDPIWSKNYKGVETITYPEGNSGLDYRSKLIKGLVEGPINDFIKAITPQYKYLERKMVIE